MSERCFSCCSSDVWSRFSSSCAVLAPLKLRFFTASAENIIMTDHNNNIIITEDSIIMTDEVIRSEEGMDALFSFSS